MASACSLAGSPLWFERPSRTIRKTATSSSVEVSFGSRGWKRMMLSSERRAPAMIERPSTSRALANNEPRIAVWATMTSPAESAKSTTKSSGRLPSVDCRTPVTAGPNLVPTDSVPTPTVHASPAKATPATTNVVTGWSVA